MRLPIALVLISAGTAFACPPPMLVDIPLTKDGTTIPTGGGVVVATVNGAGAGGELDTGGGRLLAAKTAVEMKREYLAPGLTVIMPTASANRALELVGQDGKVILHLQQTGVSLKHAAPKVTKVHSTAAPVKQTNEPPRLQMYGPTTQMTIELAEVAPDDVLALVVFQGGQGVAWTMPQPKTTTYTFWAGGKQCMAGPATVPQGTSVTLGYVDLSGRVSVLTRDIRVGATPAPKAVK